MTSANLCILALALAAGNAHAAPAVDLTEAELRRYDHRYTPDHAIFRSVLRVVSQQAATDREVAIAMIDFELNWVLDGPDTRGMTLPTDENRVFPEEKAEQVLDQLVSLYEMYELGKDELMRKHVCRGTSTPRGDAAFTAFERYADREMDLQIKIYREYLTTFDQKVVEQLESLLERNKLGYLEIEHDKRKSFALTNKSIDEHTDTACDRMKRKAELTEERGVR